MPQTTGIVFCACISRVTGRRTPSCKHAASRTVMIGSVVSLVGWLDEPVTVPWRSIFQSIQRAANSLRISTQKPIDHTIGNAFSQLQLCTADAGMAGGGTDAEGESSGAAAGGYVE